LGDEIALLRISSAVDMGTMVNDFAWRAWSPILPPYILVGHTLTEVRAQLPPGMERTERQPVPPINDKDPIERPWGVTKYCLGSYVSVLICAS
jgi:hypothetical protein